MQDFIPFSDFKKMYHSFNITESFDDNTNDNINNDATDNENSTYLFPEQQSFMGNTTVPNQIPVIENKLKDINNSITNNIKNNDNINKNYLDLHNKINDYKNLNKTVLNYNEKKITLADGLKEDINTMLVYENNMYIFSSITLALLLVGIIVVAKE